jgi:hypothetical protein
MGSVGSYEIIVVIPHELMAKSKGETYRCSPQDLQEPEYKIIRLWSTEPRTSFRTFYRPGRFRWDSVTIMVRMIILTTDLFYAMRRRRRGFLRDQRLT